MMNEEFDVPLSKAPFAIVVAFEFVFAVSVVLFVVVGVALALTQLVGI